MKNIFKILFAFFMISGLWSCKKDENKVIFEGGTSPVLTASKTGDIPLSLSQKNDNAVIFSWTNPNYKFNTGVSSQDVNYTLQFDTAGANFTSPDMQEKSVSKDLNSAFTVGDINTMMAKLGLAENVSHTMEARLTSYLGVGSVILYSNIITFTATPFLDVAVPLPATGSLFLIGGVTDPNWANPVVASQELTKTSSTSFEITVAMTGGQEFLIIPQNGSWDHKYAIKRGTNPDVSALRAGGNFGFDYGDNFYGPETSGTYKIVLNFKIGKYTITKM